nr:hypothetical protein WI23_02225 [Burkholderia oklahomensis C6786]
MVPDSRLFQSIRRAAKRPRAAKLEYERAARADRVVPSGSSRRSAARRDGVSTSAHSVSATIRHANRVAAGWLVRGDWAVTS